MVWEADKTSVAEVAKKRGDDDARCALQPHFGGMNADDARRLKALELPAMWLPPDRRLPRTRGTQEWAPTAPTDSGVSREGVDPCWGASELGELDPRAPQLIREVPALAARRSDL